MEKETVSVTIMAILEAEVVLVMEMVDSVGVGVLIMREASRIR